MKITYDILRRVRFSNGIKYKLENREIVEKDNFPVVFIPIDICDFDVGMYSVACFRDGVTGAIKMLPMLFIVSNDILGLYNTVDIPIEERDDIFKQLLDDRVDISGYVNDLEEILKINRTFEKGDL